MSRTAIVVNTRSVPAVDTGATITILTGEPSEELSVTGLVVSLGVLSSTEVEILKEWTQSNLHHTVTQVERDHCILQEQEDAYTNTQSHL